MEGKKKEGRTEKKEIWEWREKEKSGNENLWLC